MTHVNGAEADGFNILAGMYTTPKVRLIILLCDAVLLALYYLLWTYVAGPWGITLARVHAASPALHICPSSLCAHATEGLSKDVRQRKLQFMACSGAIARSLCRASSWPDRGDLAS